MPHCAGVVQPCTRNHALRIQFYTKERPGRAGAVSARLVTVQLALAFSYRFDMALRLVLTEYYEPRRRYWLLALFRPTAALDMHDQSWSRVHREGYHACIERVHLPYLWKKCNGCQTHKAFLATFCVVRPTLCADSQENEFFFSRI